MTERRLAAGDWVIANRPNASLVGFGKVVDADHDPADGALVRARVELATATAWISAGEVGRIAPEDEIALAKSVLARGLVPESEVASLRVRLAALGDGRAAFERSPGLLDRLWALIRESPGLARWFDDGAASIALLRRPPQWVPRRPTEDALRDEVMAGLRLVALARLVVAGGGTVPERATRPALAALLLERPPSLAKLLDALDDWRRGALALSLGLRQDVADGDFAAFVLAIAKCLAPPSTRAAPRPPVPPPRTPATSDAFRLLGCLSSIVLEGIAKALGVTAGDDVLAALRHHDPGLDELLPLVAPDDLDHAAELLSKNGDPVPRALLLRALESPA